MSRKNILNVKRGIVSALLAPVEEEQHNSYMVSASLFNQKHVLPIFTKELSNQNDPTAISFDLQVTYACIHSDVVPF